MKKKKKKSQILVLHFAHPNLGFSFILKSQIKHFFLGQVLLKKENMVDCELGSTDAAPEVPHPRPTRRDAATRRGRRCSRVRPRSAASGHVDPTWFSPTRADASRYGFDARRREPIRADSGRNRPVSAGISRNGRNSRFRPKFKKKKKKTQNAPKFNLVSCV